MRPVIEPRGPRDSDYSYTGLSNPNGAKVQNGNHYLPVAVGQEVAAAREEAKMITVCPVYNRNGAGCIRKGASVLRHPIPPATRRARARVSAMNLRITGSGPDRFSKLLYPCGYCDMSHIVFYECRLSLPVSCDRPHYIDVATAKGLECAHIPAGIALNTSLIQQWTCFRGQLDVHVYIKSSIGVLSETGGWFHALYALYNGMSCHITEVVITVPLLHVGRAH
jgi:hypothetical protein